MEQGPEVSLRAASCESCHKREFMHWIFTDDDLEAMMHIQVAFASGERFNPGKIFPTAIGSGEMAPGPRAVTYSLKPEAWV